MFVPSTNYQISHKINQIKNHHTHLFALVDLVAVKVLPIHDKWHPVLPPRASQPGQYEPNSRRRWSKKENENHFHSNTSPLFFLSCDLPFLCDSGQILSVDLQQLITGLQLAINIRRTAGHNRFYVDTKAFLLLKKKI